MFFLDFGNLNESGSGAHPSCIGKRVKEDVTKAVAEVILCKFPGGSEKEERVSGSASKLSKNSPLGRSLHGQSGALTYHKEDGEPFEKIIAQMAIHGPIFPTIMPDFAPTLNLRMGSRGFRIVFKCSFLPPLFGTA